MTILVARESLSMSACSDSTVGEVHVKTAESFLSLPCRCLSSSKLKIQHYLHHWHVLTHPAAQRTLTAQTQKWSALLLQKLRWKIVNTSRQVQWLYTRGMGTVGKYALENGNTRAARHFSITLHVIAACAWAVAKLKIHQVLGSDSPNLMHAKVYRYTVEGNI